VKRRLLIQPAGADTPRIITPDRAGRRESRRAANVPYSERDKDPADGHKRPVQLGKNIGEKWTRTKSFVRKRKLATEAASRKLADSSEQPRIAPANRSPELRPP